MLNSYIILLRGINVGGRNKLPMKELKSLLVDMGLDEVQTYIQSGNVVCRGEVCDAEKLRELIGSSCGFEPEVMVLKEGEFLEMVRQVPFDVSDGKVVHLYLADEDIDADQAKIEKLLAASEEYLVRGRVFYLYAPEGIGRSKLVSRMDACLQTAVTGRNWNTIQALMKMLEA